MPESRSDYGCGVSTGWPDEFATYETVSLSEVSTDCQTIDEVLVESMMTWLFYRPNKKATVRSSRSVELPTRVRAMFRGTGQVMSLGRVSHRSVDYHPRSDRLSRRQSSTRELARISSQDNASDATSYKGFKNAPNMHVLH